MARTEVRMLRRICGVAYEDGISNKEVRELAGVESTKIVLQKHRLRWFGHVERREESEIIKMCRDMEVIGSHQRGMV